MEATSFQNPGAETSRALFLLYSFGQSQSLDSRGGSIGLTPNSRNIKEFGACLKNIPDL